jgi:hypothetical protein
MYAAEQIFNSLTYEELYYTLSYIANDDWDFIDFLRDSTLEDFLYMLDWYELTYIASDDRVLLTPKGEKILQYLRDKVELEKKQYKVKR